MREFRIKFNVINCFPYPFPEYFKTYIELQTITFLLLVFQLKRQLSVIFPSMGSKQGLNDYYNHNFSNLKNHTVK